VKAGCIKTPVFWMWCIFLVPWGISSEHILCHSFAMPMPQRLIAAFIPATEVLKCWIPLPVYPLDTNWEQFQSEVLEEQPDPTPC
jgi:hypothetical protein